jgi:hypothetical protein
MQRNNKVACRQEAKKRETVSKEKESSEQHPFLPLSRMKTSPLFKEEIFTGTSLTRTVRFPLQ